MFHKYRDIILANTLNKLNYVVLGFSVLLFGINRRSEAVISASIVIFNIIIAVYQEIKAKQQLEKLSLGNNQIYQVNRGPQLLELMQDQITVDDNVHISIGMQIPCDGHIVSGFIQVDESFMTGENELIDKPINTQVYAGSNIFAGTAVMSVTQLYLNSKVKILEKKGKVFSLKFTPIENEINKLISLILVFILWFVITTSVYLFLGNKAITEIILINSVISGLVPSTLLAMITVVNSWSIGKSIINRDNLLPQKLNAFESLANVDMFCFDKTGTLTTNNLKLIDYQFNPLVTDSKGFGKYISIYSQYVSSHTKSSEIIKQNFTHPYNIEKITDVPFNSESKLSYLVYRDGQDNIKITIGAPEKLLSPNDPYIPIIEQEQAKGLRVILATLSINQDTAQTLGYFIIQEELRPEILEVFNNLTQRNKHFKIISGDNPTSILAVAQSLGLPIRSDQIISGLDIQNMPHKDLVHAVDHTIIFGRMTPDDKELIISILQDKHYVAMIGDGINDLLPIKKANLGIVLQSGASATRLASDLILLNDDYMSLIKCIEYGKINRFILRALYNIFYTRFIYLSIIYMSMILAFRYLPFTVIHTSLISLLTVGLGVITLFAVINKYSLNWKSLRGFEIILPISTITVLLAMGLIVTMQYALFPVKTIASSLLVFLVYCGLGINLVAVLPYRDMFSRKNIRYVAYLVLTQIGVFGLLLVLLRFQYLGKIWSLSKLDIAEYIRVGYFCIFWTLGIVFIYIIDRRIRWLTQYIWNKREHIHLPKL
jgi:cation-transporting P-type ATPase E